VGCGRGTRGGTREAFRVLVGEPEERGPQEGLSVGCRKNIERNIQEML
jgi:hypothetical protein